jgi:hypothetical protein
MTIPLPTKNIGVDGSTSARGALPRLRIAVTVAMTLLSAPALAVFHTCKPVDVSVYAERIHVRCNTAAPGGIIFFALSTANSAHAARMLSALTAAHLAGHNVTLEFDPADQSGTAFGCLASDCRRLLSVGIQ